MILGEDPHVNARIQHRIMWPRRIFVGAVVMLGLAPSPCVAQAPAAATAARDSLLSCAARMAGAAGFRPVTGAPPDRLGMMRTRESPGPMFLDGLRVIVAAHDSAGMAVPEVRVTTLVVSRTTGLSQQEVAPPPALAALADSIRLGCRRRR